MTADTNRWESIVRFYSTFGVSHFTAFLTPMTVLAQWISKQSFAAKLFPNTSHLSLCVGLLPGYNPNQPFFSVTVLENGDFDYQMWVKVGHLRNSMECSSDQAQSVFIEFVGWLEATAGNVNLKSDWLTSTVLVLAESIYTVRDFSAMPILADALQDAGCDNEDVLNHCRNPGQHVRGCWVIDLLLGKA